MRNKRFQLPAFLTANQILCIVLTANQCYGQNLAVTSTNVTEFVLGPILAVAVRENIIMKTAKIGPDLRVLNLQFLDG